MSDTRPIAVFDSGLGGLTVVHELIAHLPNEQIVYFGDTLRCPYGGRSKDAIKAFTKEITEFLVHQDVKMIVAACNTVSSTALDIVKEVAGEKIPVLGVVEPGCVAAYEHSADKRVGVIGTRGTVNSGAYSKGLKELDSTMTVYEKACPLLAPLVEEGVTSGPVIDMILNEYLDELIDYGVDTLVLGCTHYPLLKNAIHGVLGGRIDVIDSAWWTAKKVKHILIEEGIESSVHTGIDESNRHFYVTDKTEQFERLVQPFLHERATIEVVDLQFELEKIKGAN